MRQPPILSGENSVELIRSRIFPYPVLCDEIEINFRHFLEQNSQLSRDGFLSLLERQTWSKFLSSSFVEELKKMDERSYDDIINTHGLVDRNNVKAQIDYVEIPYAVRADFEDYLASCISSYNPSGGEGKRFKSNLDNFADSKQYKYKTDLLALANPIFYMLVYNHYTFDKMLQFGFSEEMKDKFSEYCACSVPKVISVFGDCFVKDVQVDDYVNRTRGKESLSPEDLLKLLNEPELEALRFFKEHLLELRKKKTANLQPIPTARALFDHHIPDMGQEHDQKQITPRGKNEIQPVPHNSPDGKRYDNNLKLFDIERGNYTSGTRSELTGGDVTLMRGHVLPVAALSSWVQNAIFVATENSGEFDRKLMKHITSDYVPYIIIPCKLEDEINDIIKDYAITKGFFGDHPENDLAMSDPMAYTMIMSYFIYQRVCESSFSKEKKDSFKNVVGNVIMAMSGIMEQLVREAQYLNPGITVFDITNGIGGENYTAKFLAMDEEGKKNSVERLLDYGECFVADFRNFYLTERKKDRYKSNLNSGLDASNSGLTRVIDRFNDWYQENSQQLQFLDVRELNNISIILREEMEILLSRIDEAQLEYGASTTPKKLKINNDEVSGLYSTIKSREIGEDYNKEKNIEFIARVFVHLGGIVSRKSIGVDVSSQNTILAEFGMEVPSAKRGVALPSKELTEPPPPRTIHVSRESEIDKFRRLRSGGKQHLS